MAKVIHLDFTEEPRTKKAMIQAILAMREQEQNIRIAAEIDKEIGEDERKLVLEFADEISAIKNKWERQLEQLVSKPPWKE